VICRSRGHTRDFSRSCTWKNGSFQTSGSCTPDQLSEIGPIPKIAGRAIEVSGDFAILRVEGS
jgi:hypothetical protein